MSSPYPLSYSSRWLYYYFRPSTKNHTGLERVPSRATLLSAGDEQIVKLAFFGDLMCSQNDLVPEVDAEVAAVLGRADLVFGNCEAPIFFKERRPHARYKVHFALAQEYLAEFLARLHITPEKCALSVANNHAGDQGQDGFDRTLGHLAELRVTAVGAEGSAVTVMSAGGLRIGIAAWTQWMNSEAHRRQGLVQRPSSIASQVWAEVRRELGLDLLLGFPHWDYEFQHFPKKSTQTFAMELAGKGFDAIVGHHPHVIQPAERIGDMLCFYSLGNLNGPPLAGVGWSTRMIAILELDVIASGPRKGKIAGYDVHRFAQRGPAREQIALGAIDALPDLDRSRLEERFALLFEDA